MLTTTTDINTLSQHDAHPISARGGEAGDGPPPRTPDPERRAPAAAPVPFRLPATAGYGPDAPAPSIFRAS